MSIRNFQPVQKEQPQLSYGPRPLPVDEPCAIYARQSTAKQVVDNPESARLQTTEQLKKAQKHGWGKGEYNKIHLFIENQQADGTIRSASGTLRIDEREGLRSLLELVYKDMVKAILVYSESRLFRDEFQIEVDTFIKACYEHDVRVITSTYVYDFRRNPYDAETFRMQCRIAASFITNHVKGLLHPAREAAASRGQVDGRKITVGYVVDRQRQLDDGSANPNYKKLIPYEPHAKVVRRLFRRYRELGGNLARLYKEITVWPSVFPFFTDPKHARYMQLSTNGKGYSITKEGLGRLLHNVTYIGWWYHQGQVIKGNHEAVVQDEEDFWYAFNRLSPYRLDGEPNTRETSQKHVNQRLEKGALLDGIITTTNKRRVYVVDGEYSITDKNKESGHYKVSIGVPALDAIFLDRLFAVLNDEEHGQTIEERLQEVRAASVRALVSVDEQIAEAKQKIARAERDKRIASEEDSEEDEREAIRRLKGLRPVLAELESKKRKADTDAKDIEECQYRVECVRNGWNELDIADKQRFIRLITQEIRLSEASTHFLRLEIVWTGAYGCTDTGYIWRRYGTGGGYSDGEKALLRELYPVADRAAILEALPTRSWRGILIEGRRLTLSRNRSCGNSSMLHEDISTQDDEIIQALGVEYRAGWLDKRSFWLSSADDTNKTSL